MTNKKRTMRKDNFVISSLYFEEFCYGDPGQKYFYSTIGDNVTIITTDILETNKTTVELSISPDEFNNKIYNLIHNWKRNYKPKFDICDGLMWELKIELQDGTKYKFAGHYETPDNFEDFENFINGNGMID